MADYRLACDPAAYAIGSMSGKSDERKRTRKASLAKAIKEAKRAGANVAGATLALDGSVSLAFGEPVKPAATELDEWMAKQHADRLKGINSGTSGSPTAPCGPTIGPGRADRRCAASRARRNSSPATTKRSPARCAAARHAAVACCKAIRRARIFAGSRRARDPIMSARSSSSRRSSATFRCRQ